MRPMQRLARSLAAATLLVAGLARPAVAQSAGDELQDQLRDVLQRMREMEQENEQLRDRVELLEAKDDAWLTEARADEIRQVVSDVLADADQRTSNLDGMTGGWSEHFFLASPDGRFKLQLDGQLQVRFVYNYLEQNIGDRHRKGFEITRAKLTFRGHVFNPNLTYLLRIDATRNEPGIITGLYFIQDAWIGYDFDNQWSARVGQFKLPFNREELVSSQYQLAVERSLVNENMNLGRTQGIEFVWADSNGKFAIATGEGASDNLGGFGSLAGTFPPYTNALLESVEWALTARWESLLAGDWRQFRDFTSPPGDEFGLLWGIAAHGQLGEFTNDLNPFVTEQQYFTATTDISAEWGGASAFGSFTYAYVDNGSFGIIQIGGAVAQASMYFTPKIEGFIRGEYGWWVFANDDFEPLSTVELGFNYYLDGQDVKWTTDLGFNVGTFVDVTWDSDIAGWRLQSSQGLQVVFRTQLQLLF